MSNRGGSKRFQDIRPFSAQSPQKTIVSFASSPRTFRSEKKNDKTINVQVPSVLQGKHAISFASEIQSDSSFEEIFWNRKGSPAGEHRHRYPDGDHIGDLLDRQKDSNHVRIPASGSLRVKKRSPLSIRKYEVKFRQDGASLPSRQSSQDDPIGSAVYERSYARSKSPSPQSVSTVRSKSGLHVADSLDVQSGDNSKKLSPRMERGIPFLRKSTGQRALPPQAWRLLHRNRERPKMHIRCPGHNGSKFWKQMVKMAPCTETSRQLPMRGHQSNCFSAVIRGKPVSRSTKAISRMHSKAVEYLAEPETVSRTGYRLNPKCISETGCWVNPENHSEAKTHQRRDMQSSRRIRTNPVTHRSGQHSSRMQPPPVRLPHVMLAQSILLDSFDTRRSESFNRNSQW
uniref:Uncharacterized protein n=1 Tax=Lotharella globosa TaxID=91324 RepID=A0A7S3ZCA7_9EUKA